MLDNPYKKRKSIERNIAFAIMFFLMLFCFNAGINRGGAGIAITSSSLNVLYGDVNNDQSVNPLDRTALSRKLANYSDYQNINNEAADLNYSGDVNPLDLTVFARYMANWETYETLPYFNENAVFWNYNASFPYDGTEKTVNLKGLPSGISAIYSNNINTDTGHYTATAVLMFNGTELQNISIEPLEWDISTKYIVSLSSDINTVIPGETFKVNVDLVVPPDIIDCRIKVAYNSQLFEITALKYSDGSILGSNDYSNKENYVNILFSEDNELYTTKGTVCEITFKVIDTVNAESNIITPISILTDTEFSTADFQTITGDNLELNGININITNSK